MAILRIAPLSTLAFGGISAAFAPVGSPLTHAWRAFKITNVTDGDMIFSLDGTTSNLFVPANTFVLYDMSTNSTPSNDNDGLFLGIGSQFYVKQSTAPTSGAVYIEGIYAKGD